MQISTSLFISLLFLSNLPLLAAPRIISARRESHEDYRDVAQRVLRRSSEENSQEQRPQSSAFDSAVPYQKLDVSNIANWQSSLSPIEVFHWIRDNRSLNHNGEMRRLSWLYPDDGCFARAELANQELESRFYLKPSKLFIFGNLRVKTPNSPSGEVSWWYHVVPAFRVDKKIFIFDPAIQAQRPLLLEEWIQSMGQDLDSEFTLSLCNPHTYDPDSDCTSPSKTNTAQNDQHRYLDIEQERMNSLGFNSNLVLKDLPPWRTKDEEKFICALSSNCVLPRKSAEVKAN